MIAVSRTTPTNVKFADEWLPARPGTDGALAMAMGHVVLKEFFVDRRTAYFTRYVKSCTDLPHLVRLEPGEDGHYRTGKFLTASDLPEFAEPIAVENFQMLQNRGSRPRCCSATRKNGCWVSST